MRQRRPRRRVDKRGMAHLTESSESEREKRILVACTLLPKEDREVLSKVFEVPLDGICEEVAKALSKLKTQLYATAVIVKLMNDSLSESE